MQNWTSFPFWRGRRTTEKKWQTKETLQGDDEFDRGDEEFEAARSEKIAFDRARAEESAVRARSQNSGSMAGYKTVTENDPEEEEEEENLEGNCKQPAMNPIGESRGWEK